jgi:peptide deformylase
MNFKIIEYPNSVLRKKCEKVKEITPQIKQLCSDMIETMLKNKGVGLAASQVGELKRIIVVQPICERSDEEKAKTKPQIYINPVIIKKSEKKVFIEEGCLSFPEKFFQIQRPDSIEVEALDENGRPLKIKATGFPARIFLHEIDHLDGILFIDRLGIIKKIRNKLAFKKIKK